MDVIVMGLGAVGSASAWRLAATGHRVRGFDRYAPPHVLGSTHGESRITRETAWEGARYVPLVRRANALWRELEAESGVEEGMFFLRNGGLFVARPGDPILVDSLASASVHDVPHERVSVDEIRARWPYLEPADDMAGLLDHGAGMLFPEPIIRAEHTLARRHGADLRLDEPVEAWTVDGDGVRVTTRLGTYPADRLVICTGAWMPEVFTALGLELRIERNTLHWFSARAGAPAMGPAHAPIHLICDDGAHATAIFPTWDGAIKLAAHGTGPDAIATAGTIDRVIRPRDIATVARVARQYIPRVAGEWERGASCMYTLTPHGHFILDRHPAHAQVVLGSPCNGFGFKFSAATGEALAALATGTSTPVAVDSWSVPAARAVRSGRAPGH